MGKTAAAIELVENIRFLRQLDEFFDEVTVTLEIGA
jgi:hypothetical protein